jgi:hypothetical protein
MTGRPPGASSRLESRARTRGRRSLVAAVLVADAGALAWFLFAMAGLDPALLVVAAFAGWLIALALVWYGRAAALPAARTRMGVAAVLGAWVALGGMILDWIVSITVLQGALGPFDYVLQRYGPLLAVLGLVLGAGIAALRAR